jgi:hypothetical protein
VQAGPLFLRGLHTDIFSQILINSHSGLDSFSERESRAFFKAALEIEKEEDVMVCHETHRGRILYNPWITRDMCLAFPELKLTGKSSAVSLFHLSSADLSHWCVIAERVFDKNSGYDDGWEDILDLVADHCRHIHARVGYAQGPQVPDPAGISAHLDSNAHRP